ncbi:MAG: prohibitin family protein [Chitinispirillales bacterium]|jgi:regulator of protease activity HflC (stomatin/prohibitin superfamily)|nr:prohibitin family protein [Chitinispirillales bacterium]
MSIENDDATTEKPDFGETAVTPKSKKKKKKKNFWKRKIVEKKLEWFVFFLGLLLFTAVLWPFCTVTIPAGHVGVYYSRFFGGTVVDRPLPEGIQLKFPWDYITVYDARMQSKSYDVVALTAGGLRVKVEMSIIWNIKKAVAGFLHIAVGPDYVERVIDPTVTSSLRSVIGSMEQHQLYDGNPLILQDSVEALARRTLGESESEDGAEASSGPPFQLQAILIRMVTLPDEMAEGITQKFVNEQEVLAERYRVLKSVERYKRNFVEAEAVRLTQSIVNQGMSEAYLRFRGIEATLELAKSDNAKLVLMGNKDGMPLILNPGEWGSSTSLPRGITPEQYADAGSSRIDAVIENFDIIKESLDRMGSVFSGMMERFPTADGMFSTQLPQASAVPTAPQAQRGEE